MDSNLKSGFSLIELTIVIAIFVIITIQILANYSGLSSNKSLEALAQEVALSFREAQVYGIGVRGQGQLFYSRGIHIDADIDHSQNNKTLLFFIDSNGNGTYDQGELVKTFTIKSANYIDRVCANYKTDFNGNCGHPLQSVDVLFKRPNPDAVIISGGQQFSDVAIVLKSIRDKTRNVVIWNTGQITTE